MTTIKFRRDTSVNWTSVNPIPAQGEPCYETDTGKLKIGNGSDNYIALPYVSDGGGSSGDLPIATATTLGGVKVGNNLSITEDGTLSATGGSAPTNMVTTDTDQTIEGVKRFTSRIESNNINMGGTANVTLNGGAIVINQSTTGDTTPSRIFRESNCIKIKNGISNTITSSNFFALVDRSNNEVLSVNTATGVKFTNHNGNSYILLTSNDLSNHIDTKYLEWDNANEKITIKKDAVAHLAMPSNTKVDLTLGASGTTYTAPADGYVSIAAASNYTGWIKVATQPGCYGYANDGQFITNTPITKNTVFGIWYVFSSGDASALLCRFYYCNGAVPTNTEPTS